MSSVMTRCIRPVVTLTSFESGHNTTISTSSLGPKSFNIYKGCSSYKQAEVRVFFMAASAASNCSMKGILRKSR